MKSAWVERPTPVIWMWGGGHPRTNDRAATFYHIGDGTYRLSEELGRVKPGSCTNRGSVLLAWAPLHRGKSLTLRCIHQYCQGSPAGSGGSWVLSTLPASTTQNLVEHLDKLDDRGGTTLLPFMHGCRLLA
ncbi:TPA: hypothetical protein ACH3X3_003802 [Trebouxia sp. C0006]